ncbi:stalk domain-containing protein [Clostridium formicaceticum]|uniref:DUF4430 domain-containing protein n=1 Tax=Clostridium formicaceticum TaxID=1497 RepID=A0AAC9RIK9_9CLOT|nr:stalk domain-containing protein [Clostridium formicaceticum]AOY75873.1 hypothetical protein BJL90_08190 [Clostridium formicaceticum]ARE86214.1 hypothetical protein CLFO_05360 [Clostridium formicaceticum]
MNAMMRKQRKSKISLLLVFVMLMGLLLPLGSVFSQGLEGQGVTVTDQVYKEGNGRDQPVTVATHVYDGNNKGSALEITLNLVGDSVPVAGQPVTVAAQVYNTGTSSLIALNVPLYLEDVAEPIGTEVIEELGSGAAETVSFLWTPAAAGFHNLRVVADGGYEATLTIQVFLPRPTTIEEMIAGIEGYLFSLNSDGEDGKPHLTMSLYPFALKATGLDASKFDLTADADTYNYITRLRNASEYNNNKWIDTLALADKVFDQIAKGEDPLSDIEELLGRQEDNGWFKDLKNNKDMKHNASTQARAILAIDAYYGADPDEEWPNAEEGTAKGRVGAILALIGEQYPKGSSGDTGGFLSYSFRSSLMPTFGNFQYSSSNLYGACDALVALSNYTDHPQIINTQTKETLGNAVKESIALGLEKIERDTRTFLNSYRVIPALIATNNDHLIDKYDLINVMLDKVQTNGSYKNNNNTTNLGVEYDTQQVLIALSDLLAGETAWKRIITPRAQNVKDVLADRNALGLPDAVTETIKLDLASVGPYGSTIKWYSHQPDVIDHEGMVTLPEAGRKRVTLTATISKGEIEKTRDFVITVDSQLKTRNELMLEKAVNAIGETYGTDLSNAGFKGAFALAAASLNLAEYSFYDVVGHKQGDLSQYSPQDYAEIILQLVLTEKNPYNHQGMNYVAELQNLEQQGNFGSMKDNIWALLALDAAGGTYDADLIKLIAEGIDENTPLATLGQALCGLASHRGLKPVDTAIEQAVARLESCQITEGPLAGMFFEDDEQYDFNLHAVITSGLTAVGEDLRENTEGSIKWIQSGQTPLDIFELYQLEDGSFKTDLTDTIGAINFDAVIALADMTAGNNVWSQAYLSPTDFQNLLTRAKTLIDQVLDLYTPQSGLALRNAYQEAVAANVPPGTIKGYGEKHFNLLTAINGLSMEFLPIFEDEGMYTPESFEKFKAKVTELYKTLSSEKATTEEVAEACGTVVEAYENLEPAAAAFSSAFFSQGATFAEPMAAMTATTFAMATTTATTDTQKQAQALLDKTMAAYHEYYGFDVSNGGYWRVFELASAGMDLAQYKLYDVTTHKNGLFNTYQATDYAAITLQLILTGNNPYDYQGINYVERLQACDKDNTGNFGAYGNNIWALMALDAAGAAYHPQLVTNVKNQAASEMFDTDMRGWALAAIQNHQDVIDAEEMKAIVNSFQNIQQKEGPLRGWFKLMNLRYNLSTHSAVVLGLNAAGVDLSAPEWTRDGQNPLDIIELLQREDGQFYFAFDSDVIENGGLLPGFNQDAIVALGDIVQGSNVWQRLALKPGHINDVLREAKDLLEGDLSIYTAASVNALQVAYANAITIPSGEVKGYGDRYYRLVAAIKGLDSNLIPAFTDQAKYTTGSFASFKTAVLDTRKLLEQPSTTALAVSQACETVGLAFKNLSTGSGDNPTNPGGPTDPTKPGDDITVTFTLLGGDAHGGNNGPIYIYKKNPGAFQRWISPTSVTVAADSTVYDVFTKVLKDNGYTYVGAESNYVSFIQTPGGLTLSEFSNGPKSGWMYIVNGTHPNVGLRNYVLRNGDNIIWHYTDDFTQEEGSEKWGGGGGGTVTTPEKPIEEIPIIEGQAEIDLEKRETVRISAQDVLELAENDFLTIFKEGIKVEIPMTNLITDAFKILEEETKALLEVTIKELTAAEKQEVLDKGKLGEDRGIFDIDGRIYDITLSIITADAGGNETRTKLIAYHQPVIITLDLSELNVSEEDMSQLTAVRYEVDEQDAIKVVKLGGEYDAETKLLRFYTNTLSYYGVAKARHLTKIQLAIDSLDAQVNGESIPLAQPATIINDRTMVPLRFIAEAMTAEVKWDGEEKKVTIIDQSQNKTLTLYVDQIHPELDTPPVIINGRTMVPIRYIAEQLGAYVLWHPDSQQIDIVR